MKHFILSIASILLCLPAFSQINLKDSTVQVVAYWEKGDKYNFSMSSNSYEVIGKDTTWSGKSRDIISCEIIDSTDTGYLIKCVSLDQSNHTQVKEMNDIWEKISKSVKNIPIILKTDIYGMFEGIANFEEYKETLFNNIELIRGETIKIFGTDKAAEKMFNNISEIFKSDSYVYKTIEPFMSLLAFHGGKYGIDKEYTSETSVQSPFEAGKTLDAENIFGIYKFSPETSNTVFYNELVYNKEQLIGSMMAMMNKVLPPDQQITDTSQAGEIDFKIFTQVTVHTDTGWPLFGYNLQRISSPDKTKVKEWEMEIILE